MQAHLEPAKRNVSEVPKAQRSMRIKTVAQYLKASAAAETKYLASTIEKAAVR